MTVVKRICMKGKGEEAAIAGLRSLADLLNVGACETVECSGEELLVGLK
jgi:hypothetical protein